MQLKVKVNRKKMQRKKGCYQLKRQTKEKKEGNSANRANGKLWESLQG